MVPSAFVRLDALPLTPNGKVDSRRCRRPTEHVGAGGACGGAHRHRREAGEHLERRARRGAHRRPRQLLRARRPFAPGDAPGVAHPRRVRRRPRRQGGVRRADGGGALRDHRSRHRRRRAGHRDVTARAPGGRPPAARRPAHRAQGAGNHRGQRRRDPRAARPAREPARAPPDRARRDGRGSRGHLPAALVRARGLDAGGPESGSGVRAARIRRCRESGCAPSSRTPAYASW